MSPLTVVGLVFLLGIAMAAGYLIRDAMGCADCRDAAMVVPSLSGRPVNTHSEARSVTTTLPVETRAE